MKTMLLVAACAAALAAPASAAGDRVELASQVYADSAGSLAPPRAVRSGDRLVFVLSWRNEGTGPADDFTIVNPMPPGVSFAGSDNKAESPAFVSTDNGRSWQSVAEVGTAPSGVTHIKWTFARSLAAGEAGELRFQGVVR